MGCGVARNCGPVPAFAVAVIDRDPVEAVGFVAECAGTGREAVMRQHRAKALLATGRADRAIEDFRQAVELRRGHDTALLSLAEQGLAAAQAAALRSSLA